MSFDHGTIRTITCMDVNRGDGCISTNRQCID
jgi:hypothetical protein